MMDITKKTVWGPRIFMFWILFLFRLFDTMSMAIIFLANKYVQCGNDKVGDKEYMCISS